jgi:hypothetical protein
VAKVFGVNGEIFLIDGMMVRLILPKSLNPLDLGDSVGSLAYWPAIFRQIHARSRVQNKSAGVSPPGAAADIFLYFSQICLGYGILIRCHLFSLPDRFYHIGLAGGKPFG